MNDIEDVIWKKEIGTCWALIKNKYGQLLSYNLPAYNKLYASCTYQKYIVEMLETKKYDIFLDVGAFVGLFSQVAAHNCKYVYAYEAQPIFYGILLNNMKFYNNVNCIYGYVSCKNDKPTINKNFMSLLTIDSENVPYYIDVITLDDEWDSTEIKTLIKLDVEGNELNVLDGAIGLTKNYNVHWIIDVHPPRGVELDDVKKYFIGRKITQIGKKVLKIEGDENKL